MKIVQKYFVFGTLMAAGLIFAGCGDTATDTTPAADSSTDGGDKEEGSADKDENASAQADGDFQLVSLNVPHMT